jgi:hypothetical protein
MPGVYKQSAVLDYAKTLFNLHPMFKPTQSLYIDFEGGGSESDERILSVYWPQLAGDERFAMLWRGWAYAQLNADTLVNMLKSMRCDPDRLKWITVFSGGTDIADEQVRFESRFGPDIFPQAIWVNLHKVMRRSNGLRQFVRQAGWARSTKGEQRATNSLENLEYQFGYVRPQQLRSHDYQHADGTVGSMHVLDAEQNAYQTGSNLVEHESLVDYCRWDVESMFRIARWCEKNIK